MSLASIIKSLGHGVSSAARALARPAAFAGAALLPAFYISNAGDAPQRTVADRPPIQRARPTASMKPSETLPYPDGCGEECGKIIVQHCIHSGDGCPNTSGQIEEPFGVAHEEGTSIYYVSHMFNEGIYRVNTQGPIVDVYKLPGGREGTPYGLTLTPEYIWVVVEHGGFGLKSFEREGGGFIQGIDLNDAVFPTGVTYDAFRNDFLVWDVATQRIMQYDAVTHDLGGSVTVPEGVNVVDVAIRPSDGMVVLSSLERNLT